LFFAVVALASCGLSLAAEKDDPLPTFEEMCFQFRPAFLPMADAQRMLEGVGQESRLSPGDRGKVRLKGLFRIRDWTPEQVVRFALTETDNQLRVHVWGEGHGVALFLSPAGAAYRITQQPSEALWRQDPRSVLASLVTTDDRRSMRLPPAAYQVRCQDGAVLVTKGDVRVMTVPLESPAQILYLQVPNEATLQDLAIFRSGPVPEEVSPSHRVVLDGQPAGLRWKETLPKGARLQKLGDGCVELAVENTATLAMASVTATRPGLFEVIAQIDDATPGTGIALLDIKGEPLEGIEFGREGNKTLAFGLGSPKEQPWLGNFDFGNRPVALAGPRQWLRLVVAGGSSRCWISGDGVHWGRVLEWRDRSGAWQTIALYAREASDPKKPDGAARHIRLRNLQVRELSGLTAIAAADLLTKAAAAGIEYQSAPNETPAEWAVRIARLAPPSSSPVAWRYACMLRSLPSRIYIDYAEMLLYGALREQLNEPASLQAKIHLLQDAALVWRSRQDSAQRQLELWDQLGREAVNAGSGADFELYRQALMQTSLGEAPERSGPISWELARDATILFYVAHRHADLARMEHLLTFWRAGGPLGYWPASHQLDQLLQWLEVRPMRRSPRWRGVALDVNRAVTPPLNRAASNILAELQAALESKQYADAARVLVSSDPPTRNAASGYPGARGAPDEGLVPAPDDDQLFTSFQTVVRLLMLENGGLREAMLQRFGPADQLKIEQALAKGDPAAIEALPVQYCGMPAAVLPCQWLGDRALAAADFAQAMAWYDDGLRWASSVQQPDLAARKRLVSAMLGTAQGQPPTQPVSLGGVKVPPAQFEGWVREQLSRRRIGAEVASTADSLPVAAAAQPVFYAAASFAQLHDFTGRGFKEDELPAEFREIDWSWRHLSLRVDDDSLLAVQRTRIAAFDLAGKPRWDVPLRNRWSPSPVRPLVCGPQIYIRAAVTPDRAGVACLDGKTGRKLWQADCGGAAASDPLWYHGRLFVLAIGPAGGQFVSPLCLVELHPETGDVLSRQQILETNEREKLLGECLVSWAGSRLVVLVAGSVICTDLQGRIVWLRQETTLPSAIDAAFTRQHCQPAIASEGRLLVQQPGSCAIDCLAAETGQRLWQRGIIGLECIVDLPDDRLLARTTRGLVALSKTTGEVLWQCELPGLLSALARAKSGLVLCARKATIGGKPCVVFLWIDPATGRIRALAPMLLEKLGSPLREGTPILFGPIVSHGDRTWCCFGFGVPNNDPKADNLKQIMELRPGKPALADEAP
jgi:outer membrane protein assembly factor BamB